MRFWRASRLAACGAAFVFLIVHPALAQKGGQAGTNSPAGVTPSRPGTSNLPTQPTTLPQQTNTNQWPSNSQQGPIPISGRVATDDGSPVDSNTRIERVCGMTVHLEAHVDGKGRFAFEVGSETSLDVDASTSDSNLGPRGSMSSNVPGQSPGLPGSQGLGPNGLNGCELRASAPGYHSDTIELSGRHTMDNPDVGTIVLHHVGKIDGTTTSLTTLEAPKGAKKLYEKGMQLAQKGKFDDATKHLSEATSQYPQFAIAWESLGELELKQGQADQAKLAFEAANKADPRYVNPLEQLSFWYAHRQNWAQAADISAKAISLDPVEFPGLFWCNSVANFNLKHDDLAEKSLRALLKLDTQHRFPQAEKMMGELLYDHKNVPEAAAHMRAYLALAPNAADAGEVKQFLGKVDRASVTTAASVPAQ